MPTSAHTYFLDRVISLLFERGLIVEAVVDRVRLLVVAATGIPAGQHSLGSLTGLLIGEAVS